MTKYPDAREVKLVVAMIVGWLLWLFSVLLLMYLA